MTHTEIPGTEPYDYRAAHKYLVQHNLPGHDHLLKAADELDWVGQCYDGALQAIKDLQLDVKGLQEQAAKDAEAAAQKIEEARRKGLQELRDYLEKLNAEGTGAEDLGQATNDWFVSRGFDEVILF